LEILVKSKCCLYPIDTDVQKEADLSIPTCQFWQLPREFNKTCTVESFEKTSEDGGCIC